MSKNARRLSVDTVRQTLSASLSRGSSEGLLEALVSGSESEQPASTRRNLLTELDNEEDAITPVPQTIDDDEPIFGPPPCFPERQPSASLPDSHVLTQGDASAAHASSTAESTSSVLSQVLPSTPLEFLNIEDSLEADDTPFSQEHPDLVSNNPRMESSSESSGIGDTDMLVVEDELRSLLPLTAFVSSYTSVSVSAQAVSEDIHAGLFYDADDERWDLSGEGLNGDEEVMAGGAGVAEDAAERASNDQEGGLDTWEYISPFADIAVAYDDVDSKLQYRYVREAKEMLRRVWEDIQTCRTMLSGRNDDAEYNEDASMSRLEAVRTFLPDSLLEKLAAVANYGLRLRRKRPTNSQESLGLVILHVLCASYDESPSTVCHPDEAAHFFQLSISAERYKEVWSALSGTRERRSLVDYTVTGWSRTNNRSTALILEIEQEVAACNRRLLYVPGATVLSLDDDHLRMASRSVTTLTSLQQHNNPKKGLGPVGNALCSALHHVFFACHFTRVGEKILDIWQRLIQLLQGAATSGSLQPMTDAIIAADRGYNSSQVLAFLSNVLGISLLGTHKRDLSYPFVFGDGAIRARHRGMVVSERGCRALYNASLKESCTKANVRKIEAVLYRESCSGRIASMILNNPELFSSRGFTIVPHDRFRGETESLEQVVENQVLYNELARERSAPLGAVNFNSGRVAVEQVLNPVDMLTFCQSEDLVWFILRAFKFTSRTAHCFLEAIASNYESNITGLAELLCGRPVSHASEPLPTDANACLQKLRIRYDTVFDALGIRQRCAPAELDTNSLRETVLSMSRSRMAAERRANLIILLEKLGRVPQTTSRLLKRHLIEALIAAQEDLRAGVLQPPEPQAIAEESAMEKGVRAIKSLHEASLGAWIMKPLVATSGMKEGSF